MALSGGSAAAAAFLAACGDDDDSPTATTPTTAADGGGASETAQFGEGDLGILNYALTLEYLEAKFYDEAKSRAGAKGELKNLVDLLAEDEAQHVEALTASIKRLGAIRLQNGAEPAPDTFDPTLSEAEVLKAVEPFIA